MLLRALQPLDYCGRRFKTGELFEPASEGDRYWLMLAKVAAEPMEEKPERKKRHYKTRRMMADDE